MALLEEAHTLQLWSTRVPEFRSHTPLPFEEHCNTQSTMVVRPEGTWGGSVDKQVWEIDRRLESF